jgi:thiamine biosynthesis lipoprotein
LGPDADAAGADAGHDRVTDTRRAILIAAGLGLGVLAAGTPAPEARPALQRIEASEPHMGTLARVVLYAADEATGRAAARAAFDRMAALDARLSDYRDDSEVAALSRAAARVPITASDDLITLLRASEVLARRTGGAFDVTAGRLTHLWRRARRVNTLPTQVEVDVARAAGGHRHLRVDAARHTVTLLQAGVELDLGGIAKGYAADAALRVIADRGIGAALVALGGDIVTGDPPPGRDAWTVAVPRLAGERSPAGGGEPYWIGLVHAAVSTSGDAEQWMTAGGVRYSHVLDVRTGWPLTGRRSTTVVARRGMDADALSTALGILDDAAGAALLRATPDRPSALWQHAAADGAVAAHQTSNWPALAGPAPAATP